jgi:hypothetical protein
MLRRFFDATTLVYAVAVALIAIALGIAYFTFNDD